MKLTADDANTLKVMIEGYEDEELLKIYNRLEWNTPKIIRLSKYTKEVLWNYFGECEFITTEEKALLGKLCKDII